ncbi:MAG: polymer-forming cytoskeletal protein [Spirochaetales bacterium]
MSDFRTEYIDESELETVLSEDFFFEGEMTALNPVLIKGKFKGNLKSKSTLFIEDSAEVEAEIEADRVVLRGRLKGQLTAQKKIELFDKAEVEGNISTPDLVIQSGCRFSGCCTMPPRSKGEGNGKA